MTIALGAFALVAGCNQIVGFKDVSLAKEDAGADANDGSLDDAMPDAMIDAMVDAMIDAPPPKLWTFVTNAGFTGGFGVPNGARTTADIKCQDMYNASFTNRGCAIANIHAVIQIDDTVDSLARMDITFPIPQTSEVQRATDETPVAPDWDTFVSPNLSLSAPVSTAASPVYFWSGRGVATNLSCTNWTVATSSASGNAGDATKVNSWMTQSNFTCNNFNQKLLCICW
jgi:hypothetical protein